MCFKAVSMADDQRVVRRLAPETYTVQWSQRKQENQVPLDIGIWKHYVQICFFVKQWLQIGSQCHGNPTFSWSVPRIPTQLLCGLGASPWLLWSFATWKYVLPIVLTQNSFFNANNSTLVSLRDLKQISQSTFLSHLCFMHIFNMFSLYTRSLFDA